MVLVVVLLLAAVAAAADFPSSVYPALRKAGCAGCHNPDGVASGTRLKFPEEDASPAAVAAFGRSLRALVDPKTPANSLLLTKPTRRVAHAGGKRIEPGGADEALLRGWIIELARSPETAPPVETAESVKAVGPVLRRLTHREYNNTIRDLLGDDSRVADSFPPEDFVNGFRNQYQAQSISPLLAEAYASAAEKLAKKVFSSPDARGMIPCKPTASSDTVCATKFVRSFGQKAFRRPLAAVEVQRYTRLFAAAAKGRSFVDGARTVAEAMLQSPNFLLRAEDGLDASMRPYETASRLSYFIWNSMPDAALMRAAESGELKTAAGVESSVRRMLQDPRARQALSGYLSEWLRFDRVLSSVKDRRTYPQFTPELALAMTQETERFFSDLVWEKRNFMEFFSAPHSFVTPDLATIYRVPAPKEEYGRVEFPLQSERAGILGHATFLALTSKPAETSPTARGLFVREQFLCQEVPQPPPGVSANLPPLTKDRPMTTRERLGVHLNNESCASCHTLIDPIGFGLEKFDAIGGRRDKQTVVVAPARDERNTQASRTELPLDTTGYVAGLSDSAFSSPRELGKILADSTQCQECVAKQVFRYAAGRHETAADRVVIRKAFEDFRRTGFQFQELLVSLAKWMIFPPGGNDGSRTD